MTYMARRSYFGTDGIRGVAGRHPLTAAFAQRLGATVADRYATSDRRPTFAIGMDTRRSGPMLAHAVAAGLAARGGDVTWLGVMPTPGVAFLTRHLQADAGIVISASHNPYLDNGIKLFGADGHKLSDDDERAIEDALDNEGDRNDIEGDGIGQVRRYRHSEGHYLHHLLEHAPYLDGLRVGLDCANGASSAIAPQVFQQIGARLDVVNALPDGSNINLASGSTHPDTIRRRVAELELDVGITFDGDADRALLIDRKGRLVSGDQILAICAIHRGAEAVVATLMTNLGTERYLAERGIALHRVQVGDRYVFEEMRRRNLTLGGEQSGHVLFLDKAPTGDGILTALQVLAALRRTDRPLEARMDEIPVLPQQLHNVAVDAERKDEIAASEVLADAVAAAREQLGDGGRVNVRPSGTEALIRVMVEGDDPARLDQVAGDLAALIGRLGGA
jgi:phosphoglucosamine mutase